MAWYYGTFSCGHEGRVNIIGPMKHRQWKADRAFSKMCDECYQKALQEEREEKTRLAAEKARELELPELIGSEKQVAWALRIRQGFIDRYEALLEKNRNSARPEIKKALERAEEVFDYIITNMTSAGWWIDNIEGADEPIRLLQKVKLPQKAETPEPEIAADETVRPENPKTETIAEIRIAGTDTIQIHFPERRDDFRELVKSKLSMTWNGSCWERKLNYRNGTVQNRAAEAGHRLLAAGFVVKIRDQEIREKAIAGQYEPECTRWVVTFSEGEHVGKFGIRWDRTNDDFYHVAKRLPGSRWDNPYIIVRSEHFEEVMDFADRYGFKISNSAQKLIDAARTAKDQALMVNVAAPADPERIVASTKPPVLDVPEEVGIDASLRDDN